MSALAKTPTHVDLNLVGNDGNVYNSWFESGTWHNFGVIPVVLGTTNPQFPGTIAPPAGAFRPGAPTTAISPDGNRVDVYGTDVYGEILDLHPVGIEPSW